MPCPPFGPFAMLLTRLLSENGRLNMRSGLIFLTMLVGSLGCRQDSPSTEVSTPVPDFRGKSFAVEATVSGVGTDIECLLSLDGGWDALCYSNLIITQPTEIAGQKLTVGYWEQSLPDDSVLRRPGARCRFTLSGDTYSRTRAEELSPPPKSERGTIYFDFDRGRLSEHDLSGLAEIADQSSAAK